MWQYIIPAVSASENNRQGKSPVKYADNPQGGQTVTIG